MSEIEFEVAVQSADGATVDTVRFRGDVLDTRQRSRLLKEAVVMYRANRRRGTHDTKTRGRVSGSNRKPWRQKGTGRARAGTRKSPLWRGGGIIFGPHPRDYSYSINKKQRRRALRSALFTRFRDGEVTVVDRLEITEPKTKTMAGLLGRLGVGGRVLIGTRDLDRNVWMSARNIPGVVVKPVREFNAYDVLHAQAVVLTRGALDVLLGESPARSGTGDAGDARATEGGEAGSETEAK